MSTISQRELRNDNASIVRRVEAGERFTVTRRGVPVADLVPHSDRPRMDVVFTPSADLVAALGDDDAAGPDVGAWLSDVRAADELVDDSERDPWAARG